MSYTIERISFQQNTMKLHFREETTLVLPLRIEFTSRFGKEVIVSDEEFEILKAESEKYRCREAALRYLRSSMKSEKQLYENLLKKQFKKDDIAGIIIELKENALLDDMKYAREFVLGLNRRKVVGRKYAEHKLLQKGIEQGIIKEVLDSNTVLFEDEERLFSLACGKYNALQGKKRKFEKLASSLQRLGFSTGQILSVINIMKKSGYEFND